MGLRDQVRRLPDAGAPAEGKVEILHPLRFGLAEPVLVHSRRAEGTPPDVIIDGEVVSVEPNGRTNFSQLQADLKSNRQDRLTYYAFDILKLGKQDLKPLPL